MKYPIYLFSIALLASCTNSNNDFDATGNFEADEIIVSSEASGKILKLDVKEGQVLESKQIVGFVDTVQLYLKKKQLQYSISAVLARRPDANVQLATIKEQLTTANREKQRVENLLKADAATQKQSDDLDAQIGLLKKQYAALQSSLNITTRSLQSETLPLQAQLEQIEDQLKKSRIINPQAGTVLTQYTKQDEVVNAGKALYKIADIKTVTLRVYISGNQLPGIKLGQEVNVMVDEGLALGSSPENSKATATNGYRNYKGIITWVSDKAEFTPKTIQTKEERANLVYAVKISVKNDGLLKLGMYGEVKF